MAGGATGRIEVERLSARWTILLPVLLGSFTVILNNSMLNVAIPFFMAQFHLSVMTAEWIVLGYMLSLTISMTLNGYLSGRFGQNAVYVSGMTLFLLGSVCGAFAGNFGLIVLFRVLQGVGGGMVIPLGLTMIYQHFPINQRGFASGLWGISVMLAPAIGPTVGGLLLEYTSWRLLFLINVPFGLFSAVLLTVFARKYAGSISHSQLPFDKMGFISVSVGLACMLTGFAFLSSGAFAGRSWMLIALGAAMLAFFITYERKAAYPIVHIGLFRNKLFSLCTLIVGITTGGMFAGVLLIPVLLQDVLDYGPLASGLVLLPQALMTGLAMTAGGRLLDSRGVGLLLPAGVGLAAAMTFVFGLSAGAAGLSAMACLLTLRGAGLGFINTPATTAGMNELNAEELPWAVSVNNVVRQLSGAVFISLFSLFFEWRRSGYLPVFPEKTAGLIAIRQSFLLLSAVMLLVLPAAVWIYRKEKKSLEAAHSRLFTANR